MPSHNEGSWTVRVVLGEENKQKIVLEGSLNCGSSEGAETAPPSVPEFQRGVLAAGS